MSVKVQDLVLRSGPTNPSDRLMMFVLAWHANDSGECWPGLDLLATECGVKRRAARYTLRRLERDGWITTKVGGGGPRGRGVTSHYFLDLHALRTRQPTAPTTGQPTAGSEAEEGAVHDTEGGNRLPGGRGNRLPGVGATDGTWTGQPTAPEPSVEPSVEPSMVKPSEEPPLAGLSTRARAREEESPDPADNGEVPGPPDSPSPPHTPADAGARVPGDPREGAACPGALDDVPDCETIMRDLGRAWLTHITATGAAIVTNQTKKVTHPIKGNMLAFVGPHDLTSHLNRDDDLARWAIDKFGPDLYGVAS